MLFTAKAMYLGITGLSQHTFCSHTLVIYQITPMICRIQWCETSNRFSFGVQLEKGPTTPQKHYRVIIVNTLQEC